MTGLFLIMDNRSDAQSSAKSETLLPSGGHGVITGDGFQMDLTQKVVTYFGNVKVVQGQSTLFCDKLDAFYEEFGKWKKIVATGNVRLVDGTFTATGEEGIFYPEEQKIELNRRAKVWQDNNTITAHQVIAYVAQDIVEAYGNSETERVIMTVYSGESMNFPGQPTPTPQEKPSKSTNVSIQSTPTPQEKTSESTNVPRQPTPAPQEKTSESTNVPRQPTPAPQENTSSEKEKENVSPIVIISDTLKFENALQRATFTGNVVATQDQDEIKSDEMLVYLIKTEQQQNDVERLELYGNVNITHENYLILGDTGVYHKQEQYAVVEGTKQEFARIVDTTDNITRIQAYGIRYDLVNNLVESIPFEGSRVETKFETEDTGNLLAPGSPTPTPTSTPEGGAQIERDKMPSVTLYPGKNK